VCGVGVDISFLAFTWSSPTSLANISLRSVPCLRPIVPRSSRFEGSSCSLHIISLRNQKKYRFDEQYNRISYDNVFGCYSQKRANAYIRGLMVSAEQYYFSDSTFQCQSVEGAERDRQLLLQDIAVGKELADYQDIPDVGRLLCSTLLQKQRLNNQCPNSSRLFRLDASTRTQIANFLQTLKTSFAGDSSMNFDRLPGNLKLKLSELRDYFSPYYGAVITDGHMEKGFTNCGLHFIASDRQCQTYIAAYLQEKIQYAIAALLPQPAVVASPQLPDMRYLGVCDPSTTPETTCYTSKTVDSGGKVEPSTKLSLIQRIELADSKQEELEELEARKSTLRARANIGSKQTPADVIDPFSSKRTVVPVKKEEPVATMDRTSTLPARSHSDRSPMSPPSAQQQQRQQPRQETAAATTAGWQAGDNCLLTNVDGRVELATIIRPSNKVEGYYVVQLTQTKGPQVVKASCLSPISPNGKPAAKVASSPREPVDNSATSMRPSSAPPSRRPESRVPASGKPTASTSNGASTLSTTSARLGFTADTKPLAVSPPVVTRSGLADDLDPRRAHTKRLLSPSMNLSPTLSQEEEVSRSRKSAMRTSLTSLEADSKSHDAMKAEVDDKGNEEAEAISTQGPEKTSSSSAVDGSGLVAMTRDELLVLKGLCSKAGEGFKLSGMGVLFVPGWCCCYGKLHFAWMQEPSKFEPIPVKILNCGSELGKHFSCFQCVAPKLMYVMMSTWCDYRGRKKYFNLKQHDYGILFSSFLDENYILPISRGTYT
jgi:hypothetical protein